MTLILRQLVIPMTCIGVLRALTQQLARRSALSALQGMQTKILIHRHLATSVWSATSSSPWGRPCASRVQKGRPTQIRAPQPRARCAQLAGTLLRRVWCVAHALLVKRIRTAILAQRARRARQGPTAWKLPLSAAFAVLATLAMVSHVPHALWIATTMMGTPGPPV